VIPRIVYLKILQNNESVYDYSICLDDYIGEEYAAGLILTRGDPIPPDSNIKCLKFNIQLVKVPNEQHSPFKQVKRRALKGRSMLKEADRRSIMKQEDRY